MLAGLSGFSTTVTNRRPLFQDAPQEGFRRLHNPPPPSPEGLCCVGAVFRPPKLNLVVQFSLFLLKVGKTWTFRRWFFVVTSHFLPSFTPSPILRGNSFIPNVQARTEVSEWFNPIPNPHKREDVCGRLSRFSRKTRICRSANDRCVGEPE